MVWKIHKAKNMKRASGLEAYVTISRASIYLSSGFIVDNDLINMKSSIVYVDKDAKLGAFSLSDQAPLYSESPADALRLVKSGNGRAICSVDFVRTLTNDLGYKYATSYRIKRYLDDGKQLFIITKDEL